MCVNTPPLDIVYTSQIIYKISILYDIEWVPIVRAVSG